MITRQFDRLPKVGMFALMEALFPTQLVGAACVIEQYDEPNGALRLRRIKNGKPDDMDHPSVRAIGEIAFLCDTAEEAEALEKVGRECAAEINDATREIQKARDRWAIAATRINEGVKP